MSEIFPLHRTRHAHEAPKAERLRSAPQELMGPLVDAIRSSEGEFELPFLLGEALAHAKCEKRDAHTATLKGLVLRNPDATKHIDVFEKLRLENAEVVMHLSRNSSPIFTATRKGENIRIDVHPIDTPESFITFLHEAGHADQMRDPLMNRLAHAEETNDREAVEEVLNNLTSYLTQEGHAWAAEKIKSDMFEKRWRQRLFPLANYIVERDATRKALVWIREIEESLGSDLGMNTRMSESDSRYPHAFWASLKDPSARITPRQFATLPLRVLCEKGMSIGGVLDEFDKRDQLWTVMTKWSAGLEKRAA